MYLTHIKVIPKLSLSCIEPSLDGQMKIPWTSGAVGPCASTRASRPGRTCPSCAGVQQFAPHWNGCSIIRVSVRSWRPVNRVRSAGSSLAVTRSRPGSSSSRVSGAAAGTVAPNRPDEDGTDRKKRCNVAGGFHRTRVYSDGQFHSVVDGW